jgi:hypothetical protein
MISWSWLEEAVGDLPGVKPAALFERFLTWTWP